MIRPKFVGTVHTVMLFVVLSSAYFANAKLMLYEPFDYYQGGLANQSNWTTFLGRSSPYVHNASLTFPNLTEGIGNHVETGFGLPAAFTAAPEIDTMFSTRGTYYFTGLIQPEINSSVTFHLKTDYQKITAGIGKRPKDANEPILSVSDPENTIFLNDPRPVIADGVTTHMFALKFQNNGEGSKDELYLLVDPDLNVREPNWSQAVLTTRSIDFTEPNAVNGTIGLSNSTWIPGRIDELRLATTWSEAAPSDFAVQEFSWQTTGTSNWGDPANWEPFEVPNDSMAMAFFGDEITAPTQIIVDDRFVVNHIEFNSPFTYTLQDIGSESENAQLNFDAENGNASLAVVQGHHVMDVPTNAERDLHVDIARDMSLSFTKPLNLNGNELIKSGFGSLSIQNELNTGGSALTVSEGTLAAGGTIIGDLNRLGGILSPESLQSRIGKLTINGNDTQGTEAELVIEIAGTAGPGAPGGHDQVWISGSAYLDGKLTIVTDPNFLPAGGSAPGIIGDTFVILQTGPTTVNGEYSEVIGDHLGCGLFYLETYTSTQLTLGTFQALEGDADGDRDIDITDFNIFTTHFGNTEGMTWTEASFDKDFDVDITDFNFIAANFADSGYVPNVSIPEPANLGTLVLGGLLLGVSWWRRMISGNVNYWRR